MPDDLSWMDQTFATPGAPPGAAAPPTLYPSFGSLIAPHPAPDGSGEITNLSDADYAAFKGGSAGTVMAPRRGSETAPDKAVPSGQNWNLQTTGPEPKADTSWMDSTFAQPGPPPDSTGAPPPPQTTWQGIRQNIGAGLAQGGAAIADIASDPFGNLIGKPIAAGVQFAHDALAPVFGYQRFPTDVRQALTEDTVPQPASRAVDWAFQKLGAPAPSSIQPATPTEAAIRTGASAVPLLAAGGGLGAVTTGVPAVVAGTAGAQQLPEWMQPAAEQVAPMVAGAGMKATGRAAGAITQPVRSFAAPATAKLGAGIQQTVAPFSQAVRERIAAQRLSEAITQPEQTQAALANIPPPNIPGSAPTTFQVTGDPGIGQLERGARTGRYAAEFQAQRQAQTEAQTAAVRAQRPADADIGTVRPFFEKQLADLNAAHDADTAAARSAAQAAVGRTSAVTTPYAAGGTVRAAVERARAPALSEANRRLMEAQIEAEARREALGQPAPAQTHGARMREALEGARRPAKEAAGDLFDLLDPDGTLALDVSGVAAKARQIRAELNQRMGGKLAPAETDVLDAAAGMRGVERFSDLRELRTNVTAALRDIGTDPKLGRESRPYRRMTQLLQSIDGAITDAADEQAHHDAGMVSSGTLDPNKSISARVGRAANEGPGDTGRDTGLRLGDEKGPGGAGAVSQQPRADVAPQGQPKDGAGYPPPSPQRPTRTERQTLVGYLQGIGGLKDTGVGSKGGDLRSIGVTAKNMPTVLRTDGGGFQHDVAAQMAYDEGFLSKPDVDELHKKLSEHLADRPTYRQGAQAEMEERAGAAAQQAANEHALDNARETIRNQNYSSDHPVRLTPEEEDFAAFLHASEGMHPQTAIEMALRNREEAGLQQNAQMNAFGQPGMPLAEQLALPGSEQPQLTANFTAADRDALRRANAAYADYKARFGSGAVGKALASSAREPSGYRVANAAVPSTLFQPGPAGAEAADSMIRAAGSPEAARTILGDYPAQSLRAAVEKMPGTFDQRAYQSWMTRFGPFLDKFPALRAQFESVGAAQRTLAEETARRDAIDAANPLNPGWGDAQIMERLVQPGPKGYEGAEALVRETNSSPAAMAATTDYLASSMRDAAEVKSGPNAGTIDPGAYQRWMSRYQSFLSHPAMAELRARFATAERAQATLDQATQTHQDAVTAYQKSVARHFLGGMEPETAIGAILNSRTALAQMTDLAEKTARDPAARQAIQASIVEHMLDRLLSNRPTGTDFAENELKADQTQTFIRQHISKDTGALRKSGIMEPAQLDALQSVADDIRQSNLSITASKFPGGSDTAQNLAARRGTEHGGHDIGIGGWVWIENLQHVMGHYGGLPGRIGGAIAAYGLNRLYDMTQGRIDGLLKDAILHPEQAKALLDKLPADGPTPSRLAAMKSQVLQLGLTGAAMPDRRRANDNTQTTATMQNQGARQ